MCQKDAANTADTHPCADSVVDFKVDSDGTTDIMYEPHTDSTGYKRTVTIKLKCNEGKSPGEIDGVTEDYAPMDSKYKVSVLENHLDVGEHRHGRGGPETVYDKLRRDWAEKFLTVDNNEGSSRAPVAHCDERGSEFEYQAPSSSSEL
ncbi:hypothetical protein ACROYT_G024737 [Oculina patagonica]